MNLRRNILLLMCVALIGCGAAPSGHSESFTDKQRTDIEQIVHDYLVKNPEILQDMITALDKKQQDNAAVKAQKAIKDNAKALFHPGPEFVAGNPNGDVTVVEFFDFRCGYCRASVKNLRKLIDKDSNVRLVFKDYPVLGPASLMASQAALAAAKQGRYVDFHWAIMSLDEPVNEESVFRVAKQLGLDIDRMKKDMKSDEIAKQLGANIQLADELGINGTPAFIFGDKLVPGAVSYNEMVKLVKQARSGDKT